MIARGQWLLYAAGDAERARDYQFSSFGENVPPPARDAFVMHAGRALEAVKRGADPVWQFVSARGGVYVLSRGATQRTAGHEAPAVLGLLIPQAYVTSEKFALHACALRFPPAQDAPPLQLLALDELPPPLPATEAACRLANLYLQDGSGRVAAAAPGETLLTLCQAVEALPAADRGTVSFATAALNLRDLEPGDAADIGQSARMPGFDRLAVWRALLPLLTSVQSRELSLRGQPSQWLAGLLDGPDVAHRFAQLCAAWRNRVEPAQSAPAHAVLRGALEQRLARMSRARAGTILAQLQQADYLSESFGVGPLWLTRVAAEGGTLAQMPPAVLGKIFRAESLTLLLGTIRNSDVLRLAAFVHATTLAAQPGAEDRLTLLRACSDRFRQLVGRQALKSAEAAALLSLYRHALPSGRRRTEYLP